MLKRANGGWVAMNKAEGGEGGRGATFHPALVGEGPETNNKKATAADSPCGSRDIGGGPTPAAGLEPATRRLTGLFRTPPIRRNTHRFADSPPGSTARTGLNHRP